MLSKEHIEKGCELVERYIYCDETGLTYITEYADMVTSREDTRYRDFLQLVIEGIERQGLYKIIIDQNSKHWWILNQKTHEYAKPNKYSGSITQAKEKAIAYVFDNMEVK